MNLNGMVTVAARSPEQPALGHPGERRLPGDRRPADRHARPGRPGRHRAGLRHRAGRPRLRSRGARPAPRRGTRAARPDAGRRARRPRQRADPAARRSGAGQAPLHGRARDVAAAAAGSTRRAPGRRRCPYSGTTRSDCFGRNAGVSAVTVWYRVGPAAIGQQRNVTASPSGGAERFLSGSGAHLLSFEHRNTPRGRSLAVRKAHPVSLVRLNRNPSLQTARHGSSSSPSCSALALVPLAPPVAQATPAAADQPRHPLRPERSVARRRGRRPGGRGLVSRPLLVERDAEGRPGRPQPLRDGPGQLHQQRDGCAAGCWPAPS